MTTPISGKDMRRIKWYLERLTEIREEAMSEQLQLNLRGFTHNYWPKIKSLSKSIRQHKKVIEDGVE